MGVRRCNSDGVILMAAPKRYNSKKKCNKFIKQRILTYKKVIGRNINLQNPLSIKPYIYMRYVLTKLHRDKVLYLYHNYPLLSHNNKYKKMHLIDRKIHPYIQQYSKYLKINKNKYYSYHHYQHYNNMLSKIYNAHYSSLIGHTEFSVYADVFKIGYTFVE